MKRGPDLRQVIDAGRQTEGRPPVNRPAAFKKEQITMKLFDRITLLRAGYSRQEIDAMIEEEKNMPEPEAVKDPDPVPEANPEPEAAPEPVTPPAADPEPEVDYKKAYEKEKAEKEALQQQNIRRNNKTDDDKSDEDIVKDIVASFI